MQEEFVLQLKSNPLQNMPVLGFFENYPVEKYVVYNKSMILAGTSDYTWAYLAVHQAADMDILLEKFAFNTLYFANVEDWMLPHLTQNHQIEWRLATDRYYLPENSHVSPSDKKCGPLTQAHVSYIYQHSAYKDFTSEPYIRQRIEKDISAGVWVNDQLAGWGLTHDDSSLGFLNVMPSFRGQGIGEAIFRTLVMAKQEKGKPVFLNVESHNKQSIGLARKVGFVFDRSVSWIKLTAET